MPLDTFTWGGQTRYRCPDCPFDSYSEAAVLKHWVQIHGEITNPGGAGPTLFDAEEKPIHTRREIHVPAELDDVLQRLGAGDVRGKVDPTKL